VTFLATGEGGDAEMRERIEAHRRTRPPSWSTVEEPLDLQGALAAIPPGDCVIVDCLTLWTSNALARMGADGAEAQARSACDTAAGRAGLTVAVTNEVGMGVVPDSELGRSYRDLLGRVNTTWAAAAERTLLLVAGRAIQLHDPGSLWEASA
jgi:adenosyl cobinamide kinase/adenosyl cobinamide phosphate guanylyltransferase